MHWIAISGAGSGAGLGLLLGMRHALEPDHLMAVSALLVEQRSPRHGALLGAAWGLGHTAALLCAALVLSLMQVHLPAGLAEGFELLVALMLILLGFVTLRRALQKGREGPAALHQHRALRHVHRGPAGHVHLGPWTLAGRPLLIGMVHGLAGSGALTTLVLAQLGTVTGRLVYVTLFGLGSLVGMALLSGLVGLPLARLTRSPRLSRALAVLAGVGSVGLGVAWGLPCAARWLG